MKTKYFFILILMIVLVCPGCDVINEILGIDTGGNDDDDDDNPPVDDLTEVIDDMPFETYGAIPCRFPAALVFDSNLLPHVVYLNYLQVRYAYRIGEDDWHVEDVEHGNPFGLVVEDDGTLHTAGIGVYSCFNGTSWITETIDPNISGVEHYDRKAVHLLMDSTKRLHYVYADCYDNASDSTVYYATKGQGEIDWNCEILDSGEWETRLIGRYVWLVITSDDVPWVMYQELTRLSLSDPDMPGKVKVLKKDGDQWVTVTEITHTNMYEIGAHICAIVSPDDVVHLAYAGRQGNGDWSMYRYDIPDQGANDKISYGIEINSRMTMRVFLKYDPEKGPEPVLMPPTADLRNYIVACDPITGTSARAWLGEDERLYFRFY